ncbi:hypothetical protein [Vibrio vulnificus]|uniref:hypothetical protein n=1 Tax=Vibrio vulnificus TaxID=672 RepID=UPI000F4E6612|nr:hypothetical protein [Vibrio vulnificus]MCA3987360.1 hypothetical protein [Vibrio vulnificus]MCA3989869.1 hypothetical protein [Vibrio vulnificus]MCU8178688.1 hypothetical protein [Vibrio vulnificus]RPB36391.1 hypothetical protein CYV18_04665 [Vibrio vulnificus]
MFHSNANNLQTLNSEVLSFLRQFQSNPFRYLFESDIQGELFTQLRHAIPDVLRIAGGGNPLNEYDISIVNSEYLSRLDIALLDVEKAPFHPVRNHKGFDVHLYDCPVFVGIEIKFRKLGDNMGLQSCLRDTAKLRNLSIPTPVILGFIQAESDVRSFFKNAPKNVHFREVNIDAALGIINIISPKRRWIVTENTMDFG